MPLIKPDEKEVFAEIMRALKDIKDASSKGYTWGYAFFEQYPRPGTDANFGIQAYRYLEGFPTEAWVVVFLDVATPDLEFPPKTDIVLKLSAY